MVDDDQSEDRATVLPIEESAEELYDNAPCGYFSSLPDGTFARVNRTFLEWTGYTREELVGKRRFSEILTIGGRIYYETHFAPLLRMQGFISEIQLDIKCKDGTQFPVLFNTTSKTGDDGEPLFHRTTVFNVADRKKYERELVIARKKAESAAKAKADFLSMMSHEIRTPMGVIVGVAALLQKTDLSPAQKKYVRLLQSSSDNLLALLNDILDFSKMEAGKAALEARPFDLRRLVYGTLYALNVKAEAKKLDIRVDIDERLPQWVMGDAIKIGQVLTNLASNAIKFTSRGGVTVVLEMTELEPHAVSFETRVVDTGIGIAPERLTGIFEEFTQASAEIGVKYGGTGLGLAICQKVLEMHGSRLSVTSTVGEGSCFSFPLRLQISDEAPKDADGGDVVDTGALRGARALLAEDNEVNQIMICQFLRDWGVEVEVARNGKEALQRLHETEFDIILMDLRMPEMDGYEATRAIRALPDERRAKVPIIAVTASTRIDIDGRMAASGFDDFVGKPFNPADLYAKLEVLVARATRGPA